MNRYTIISSDTLIYVIIPLIERIILDISSYQGEDEELSKIRNQLFEMICSITTKRHYFFTNNVKNVIRSILSNDEYLILYGEDVLDCISQWVKRDKCYDTRHVINTINLIKKTIVNKKAQNNTELIDCRGNEYDQD